MFFFRSVSLSLSLSLFLCLSHCTTNNKKHPKHCLLFPEHLDQECQSDVDCPSEKACIGGQCSDPCTMRGACGENALCQTVLHRPRCTCPNCYVGRPHIECTPDPNCAAQTTPRPNVVPVRACREDSDCHQTLHCDTNGQCTDPCENPTYVCEGNKRCETRRHRPVCVCKAGFIVNEYGELICAPETRECHRDDECASNKGCIEGRCVNPCAENARRGRPCPSDKQCQVVDRKAVCVCMKDCHPSLSICLRDTGCPSDKACRNYQCVNPCDQATCAANSPCYVEDHKPICKFCPPGFVADARNGCLKGKNTQKTNDLSQKKNDQKNEKFFDLEQRQ